MAHGKIRKQRFPLIGKTFDFFCCVAVYLHVLSSSMMRECNIAVDDAENVINVPSSNSCLVFIVNVHKNDLSPTSLFVLCSRINWDRLLFMPLSVVESIL